MNSKEEFRKMLVLRAKRLVELLDMSAPEQLIAKEIVLVLKSGVAAMPGLVFQFLSGWFLGLIRNEANFCATCDSPPLLGSYKCAECLRLEQEEESRSGGN